MEEGGQDRSSFVGQVVLWVAPLPPSTPFLWPPPYLTANLASTSPSPLSACSGPRPLPLNSLTMHTALIFILWLNDTFYFLWPNIFPSPPVTTPYSHMFYTYSSLSPVMFALFCPPPRFPLPILQWRRGWASSRLLSSLLPPGLPSNYCILSFEKRNGGKKEGKEEYNHLLPKALLLQRYSLKLTSLSYTNWFMGVKMSVSQYFKLCTDKNISHLYNKPHLELWWKSFHPPVFRHSHHESPSSRSVTSRFLCVTHGCQGCTNTKQHARKQTRRDQYARLIKQWHKQSCWILLLVICWCIWISPNLKE